MKKTVLFLLAPMFFVMVFGCSIKTYSYKSLVGSHTNISLIPKDYDIVDRISVVINIDRNFRSQLGLTREDPLDIDESFVEEELLKKAWSVGADEIVNVRIYKKFFNDSYTSVNDINELHGTALAIKYKDSSTAETKIAEPQSQNENAPKARARRSQRTQQN